MPVRALRAGGAIAAALIAAACATPRTTGSPHAAGPPSPTGRVSAVVPRWAGLNCGAAHRHPVRHVIWIWMENHNYGSLIGPPGSPAARQSPYLNRLARGCALATNYRAVTHPSLPNYIAATSGGHAEVFGDCPVAACPVRGPSLFGQLASAHRSWAAYDESMPSACRRTDAYPYAARHDPAVYYTALRTSCARHVLPLPGLSRALATRALPSFSFVTPNLCDDTHDCAVGVGDRWLATWVPRIVASPAYVAGDSAIFVTWDEGEGSDGIDCTRSGAASCHIPLVVVSPDVAAGRRVTGRFTHYSLLRATEDLLGLPPLGRGATSWGLRAALGL